jgi:SAM-dependent methyltransferase
MSNESPSFDRVGDKFVEYYDTVRGHVRELLVRENIEPYLATEDSLFVADIGGGDGRDAVWLAKRGHTVVLADVSDRMLKKAEDAFKKQPNPIKSRVAFIEGSVESVLQEFGPGHFDLVLSHGVLMYDLKDPETHVAKLFELVRPLGHVSLLTKGYEGARERLEQVGSQGKLKQFQTTNGQFTNRIGVEAKAYTPKALEQFIVQAGGVVLDWYGVRIDSDNDFRPYRQLPSQELQSVLEHERKLESNAEEKHRGQMLHFVAQKQ